MSDRPTAQQSEALTQVSAESAVGANPVLGELTIDQRPSAIAAPVVLTGDLAAAPNNARKMPVKKSAQTMNARRARKRFRKKKRWTTESNCEFVFRRRIGRIVGSLR
jgi:hypothetical protein